MMRMILLGLCVLLLSVSCKKISDDKTDPTIQQFDIADKRLAVGENLVVTVSVADNEELSQVKVRVQEAFSKSFGFWMATRIDNTSEKTFAAQYFFAVPDSALAGYYSVSLQAVDERGNASIDSLQYISIIRDDQAPSLINFETVPAYDANATIQISGGDTLRFTGLAFDIDSLRLVEIDIRSTEGSLIQNFDYRISDTTDTFDFGISADSVFFNFSSTPAQMLVKATDSNGHMLRESFSLDYTP